MSEQEFNTIFSKNLNHFLSIKDKTQAELAKYVGVSATSVSYWCKGTKIPRMDKVDKICSFLMIKRSDLMYDHDLDSQLSALSEPASPTLDPDEQQLLDKYRSLNAYGKRRARQSIDDLTKISEYIDSRVIESLA